ncbi:hypothetical protein LS482_11000 [Sinomicrobium kalidii]|uniref:hypothetical protein n=1 Tax=Sinomicrobium kalidii TaxID=2900738 RepID=UPI001E5A02D0|nr:hypothetical protein [Sinomicrobium kalidii]UGU14240.1 hypothetical protein LS482_11000 [Sinomicrobium kalidii]
MVRIINYKQRQAEDGREFFVLEISGGIEMVRSKETGHFYATSKKTSIPSTFDEETCAALIGTEMPGQVVRQEVEPYSYVVKETGEELTLSHRWVYIPEEDAPSPENELRADVSTFSQNGQYAELAQ